jgi:hypothetical protein
MTAMFSRWNGFGSFCALLTTSADAPTSVPINAMAVATAKMVRLLIVALVFIG